MRGEFFAARPAGSIFGNSGMSGSLPFGYFDEHALACSSIKTAARQAREPSY